MKKLQCLLIYLQILQSFIFGFYFFHFSSAYIFFFINVISLQDHNLTSHKSLRNSREKRPFHSSHHHYRGSVGGEADDSIPISMSPYHLATQRKYPRGTQSCNDGLSDDFDRFSGMNRSFASVAHSKYKVFVMSFYLHL